MNEEREKVVSKEQLGDAYEEKQYHPSKLNLNSYEDVVISGISGRFPESNNMKEFRDNLMNGVDMVTEDDRRWPPGFLNIPRRMGKLKEITKFDHEYFPLSLRVAEEFSINLRIALEVVYEAIVDAGIPPKHLANSRTGVYACSSIGENLNLNEDAQGKGYKLLGSMLSTMPNVISNAFNFNGPSVFVDTACSSGLHAIDLALQAIRDDQCDNAIAVTSMTSVSPFIFLGFKEIGAISQSGKCAPFNKNADGYVRSEAVVAVLLQKASSAKRIYATILHSKTNADGWKVEGITYPSKEKQAQLFFEIYAEANIDPSNIAFLEAHGTGTAAGDVVEGESISKVFLKDRKQPLLLSSTKSNMGHAEISSALCSLAKIIIAMEERVIPRTLHFFEPNPDIPALEQGRLKIVTENTPWKGGLVGLNNFGFTGANAHIILQSNPIEKEPEIPSEDLKLFAFSGRTEEAVETMLHHLESDRDPNLYGLLGDLMDSPDERHPYRGFTILNSNSTIRQIQKAKNDKRPVWFIFPGMGVEWIGMGRDHMQLEVFRNSIMKCAEIMKPHGYDICNSIINKDYEKPLLGFITMSAVQIALVDVLRDLGIEPDGMIGHSAGEIGCAYADGCFDLKETLLNAYYRAKTCFDLDPSGDNKAMAVVGISASEVKRTAPPGVFAGCHNAENYITISGESNAVDAYLEDLQKKNIFVKKLNSFGFAFHSPYMEKYSSKMLQALHSVVLNTKERSPRWISTSIPESLWNTPLAKTCSSEYFVNNSTNPVLFYEGLRHIPPNAITIEIGAHALLTLFLKNSLSQKVLSIGLMSKYHSNNLEYFLTNIGILYINGLNTKVSKLYPAVSFPVARGTSMISPYIKWNHSKDWQIFSHEDINRSGVWNFKTIDISNSSSPFYYLNDYKIDGKILVPAAAYLVIVWNSFANSKWDFKEKRSVIFENMVFTRPTILSTTSSIKFIINLSEGNGQFQVIDNVTVVASGSIRSHETKDELDFDRDSQSFCNLQLNSKDIYKELNLLGYEYGPEFQGIMNADVQGEHFELLWNGNWVTFIDSILQSQLIATEVHSIQLPMKIRSVVIDPIKHLSIVEECKEKCGGIPLLAYTAENTYIAGGVKIEGIKLLTHLRRPISQSPELEEYLFQPYEEERCFGYDLDFESKLKSYSEVCTDIIVNICQKLKKGQHDTAESLNCYEIFKIKRNTNINHFSHDVDSNLHLYKALTSIDELSIKSSFENQAIECLDTLNEKEDLLLSAIFDDKILKQCVDLMLENITSSTLKVLEIEGNNQWLTKKINFFLNNSRPDLNKRVKYTKTFSNIKNVEADANTPEIAAIEWDIHKNSLLGEGIHLIIANELIATESKKIDQCLQNIKDSMKSNGFLLLIEPKKGNFISVWINALKKKPQIQVSKEEIEKICARNGLQIVSYKSDGIYQDMYLLRKISPKPFDLIFISEDKIGRWLQELKSKMTNVENSDKNVWLVSYNEPTNGIVGLVNCLRKEAAGDKVRCIFWKTSHDLSFERDIALNSVICKDMVMNIYEDGKWGSMRHLPMKTDNLKMARHVVANPRTIGDLSSLTWYEYPFKQMSESDHKHLCHVYYTGVNFRDLMLASGRISTDAFRKDALGPHKCLIGVEFAGRDKTGKRICGIGLECMASTIILKGSLNWDIPEHWTMEEAATVPVVYTTVYLAFFIRGNLQRGNSILIHSGAGGVGQAAINVALSMDCEVYTTVGTAEKREFLKTRFPSLKDDHIGNSRDTSFERFILKKTKGKGVDVVLNSLAGEKLLASVRCVAESGTFLDIGLYDFLHDSPLGMGSFLKQIKFIPVEIDCISVSRNQEILKTLHALISKGIETGVIQPLNRKVYDKAHIEDAFRFMTTGNHIGKIVIKIREEEKEIQMKHSLLFKMFAVPRVYAHNEKSFIITGGLGGFGLELARWLIDRTAKHIILSTHSGIKTGFQLRCLHLWKKEGINIVVSKADITTESGCRELINEANFMAPVGGIFHLAMILQDGAIENQTEATFNEVLNPKFKAALHLDKASRSQCPMLEWFVVFSSVACGRGNAGQTNYGFANSSMERICELRRKENLPGLAIQWGIIGDVGVVHEFTGGGLITKNNIVSQKIHSCMEVMDKFLNQDVPIVSSWVTVAKSDNSITTKQISAFEKLCCSLGVEDPSTFGENTTIGSLGADSMMLVEIQQILERDFQLILASNEIRELSITRLKNLIDAADVIPSDSSEGSALSSNKKQLISKSPASVLYLMPKKRISKLNEKSIGRPLFVIHGFENSLEKWKTIASKINCPVFGLQNSLEGTADSISIVVKKYVKEIRSIQSEGPYQIIGYTFGTTVAIEIANQLKDDHKQITTFLILVDGSHEYSKMATDTTKGLVQSNEMEAEVLCIFLYQFMDIYYQKEKNYLKTLSTREDRIKHIQQLLSKETEEYQEEVKVTANALLNLLDLECSYKSINKYQGNVLLLNIECNGLKEKNVCSKEKFQQMVDGKLIIKTFDGELESFFHEPNAERVANVINEYLNI